MRILGYIGTYNEEIERPLAALQRQTKRLDEILVVDNASTDFIPKAPLPDKTTLIRNSENLGPSGAITTAFQYALELDYDWIWIFDADSAPRDDALEKLVSLYNSLNQEMQHQVGILSCAQILAPSKRILVGRCMTPSGPRTPRINPDCPYSECDATIWSGTLFKLEAVRRVGMPRSGRAGYWEDLGHDYGDFEFSYRIRRAGYRVLVYHSSIVDQSIGKAKYFEILGWHVVSTNHPAARRYLYFRNLLYFWLYLYPKRQPLGLSIWIVYRFSITLLKILLMENNKGSKIAACFRGALDGVSKRLNRAYARPSAEAH